MCDQLTPCLSEDSLYGFSKETLSAHVSSFCSLKTMPNFRSTPPLLQETFLTRRLNSGPVAGQPRRQQQAVYRVPAVWSCDLASELCSQVTNKTLALTGA